ncbi:MAG: DUF1624 domain-containing protein, partial [Acetobacteraceae bacterium]
MVMTHQAGRLDALDVLRGLAVAGMILVVSPGDWAFAYAPLRHADWDGWTLADMVFPTFLFSVGLAVSLAFPKTFGPGERRAFWIKAARRVGLLILIGLLLETTYILCLALGSGGPGVADLGHMRLPGVLQRIALCYLLAVVAVMATGRREPGAVSIRPRAIGLVIAAILLGYWLLMSFVPVPGHGAGHLDPAGNLAAFIDRTIFTPDHLWQLGWAEWGGPLVYDPEGLLSTLPAATNVLFGVLAGHLLTSGRARPTLLIGLGGLTLFLAGLALDPLFVINKRIWTSSFALLSSGVSAMLLASLLMALPHRAATVAATPFRILGANAIAA